jgi:hypothetical protein
VALFGKKRMQSVSGSRSDDQKTGGGRRWQPKHLRGASARAAPNRLQREFRANVNFLGVPWDRRTLSMIEAALQLKVTLRNLFIDQ